jgi:hypothetical protein
MTNRAEPIIAKNYALLKLRTLARGFFFYGHISLDQKL